MAKIDGVALVLTSYSDDVVCHDLIVEKVLKVEPYVPPAEAEAGSADPKKAPAPPAKPPAQ